MKKNESIDTKYGVGICDAIKMDTSTFVAKKCTKAQESYDEDQDSEARLSNLNTCKDEAEEKFEDNPVKALSLISAADAVKISLSPGVQNAWKSIGEKYSGTACAAINGSQLGQKGLIPGLMEKINRDIASEDGMIQ